MKLQLDELLSQLGNPGKYQKVIFMLIALNYLPVVFSHVIMAFIGSTPKHQCYSKSFESKQDSQQMTSGNLIDNSSMTANQSFIVDKRLNKCRAEYFFQSEQNVSVVCGVGGAGKINYNKEPRETTIVTEWNLVCDIGYLSSLANTIFYVGVMLGSIFFGHIADKFGRRLVMLLTLFMSIFVGVGIAFAPWYWLFVALRFIQGILIQGLHTSSCTLAMELFLPKYWSHAGVLLECFWGFGVMLLPALAYLIQDWRYLQLATCLPSILAFGYIWFATSFGYYGLTWKLTELAGNKYLNFFIGGAVEFVAYILVLPVTK
ncbi:hypothetical protein ACJMK2_011007, partial [Sinanodonta woodiana]